MCYKYDDCNFYLQNTNGKLDVTTYPPYLGFDEVESDIDHPIFNNLLIDCYSITFWFRSVVNPTILRKFAKHCNTKAVTRFRAEDGTISDLSLPLICDIFENVKKVYLKAADSAYNRWIQDVLHARKLDLKEFGIQGRFDELFSFESKEMSQLFQAQDTEFFMVLYCSDPPQDAVELIRQKLGVHFKEFSYKRGHIDGVLHIKLGNTYSGITRMWFQVGPVTPRIQKSSTETTDLNLLKMVLSIDEICRQCNKDLVDRYATGIRTSGLFKTSAHSEVIKLLDNPSLFELADTLAEDLGLVYLRDFLKKCASAK
uniref:F-box domain-containing protein n=1 Tax=Panagrellus redivivus TaxID=6233 RepID=A0A7E4V1W7_PANRE